VSVFRRLSEYRWPIYIGAHLALSVVACGVLVYVATRPDAPRPIAGYYEAARTWDVDEAVAADSRQLGWTVQYALAADVPYVPGMPRPVDVDVADRHGRAVTGLSGRLVAIRPSDTRRNQSGTLVEIPQRPGRYRTLVRLDEPGVWEFRLDTRQQMRRFVHTGRISVEADQGGLNGASK
jgi:hypothetical protein